MTAILDELPAEVSLYEVGPRDGLQNEAVTIGTVRKLRLIEALIASGLKRIEITSFVSPHWIPQLADADRLADLINVAERSDVRLSALCPNSRGLARARVADLKEVAVFLSASETHNKRNINKSIDQAVAVFTDLIPQALEYGMRVRAYVSTAWGCPYEGPIDVRRPIELTRKLIELGCYEVSLGDTIGVGTPRQTKELIGLVLKEVPASKIAMHMHDTRGQALANVLVGLDLGIRTFDSAIAGLGGCPYAPGASGNLATEDLVYMLDNMGVRTGVDPEKLFEAGRVAEAIVRRELPGRVHRAGLRALKG